MDEKRIAELGTVAVSMELQQNLLDAKLVYRPPNIATAFNGMAISRLKW